MSVKKQQGKRLKQNKLCNKKCNWVFLALSFAIPFLGFLAVLLLS